MPQGQPRIHQVPLLNVPADGYCLSHCVAAALNLDHWMAVARNADGQARDRTEEQTETTAARSVLEKAIENLHREGHHQEADRLTQAGREGYPGGEEMNAFASVLGGGIEVVPLVDRVHQRILQYGRGPLLLRVGQTISYDITGHSSPHYVLMQVWAHQPSAQQPALVRTPQSGDSIFVLKQPFLDLIHQRRRI